MTTSGPHISISAEPLFHVGNFAVTNSVLGSLLISALLIIFALIVRIKLTQTSKPSGLQNFAEWVVESLYNFINSITVDAKKTRLFFPLVSTFFLFIILNNWFGLVPGVGTITYLPKEEQVEEAFLAEQAESLPEQAESAVQPENVVAQLDHGEEQMAEHHAPTPIFRSGTADLNTTLALALISVIMTQVFGLASQKLSYIKKFINFSSPMMFFVGALEIVSELAKIISFSFRLFGNIFAGEVLLVVIAFLVPIIVPMPFYGLELFVGFIQALVFTMLSLVFFNMATQSHDH